VLRGTPRKPYSSPSGLRVRSGLSGCDVGGRKSGRRMQPPDECARAMRRHRARVSITDGLGARVRVRGFFRRLVAAEPLSVPPDRTWTRRGAAVGPICGTNDLPSLLGQQCKRAATAISATSLLLLDRLRGRRVLAFFSSASGFGLVVHRRRGRQTWLPQAEADDHSAAGVVQ